MMKNDSEKCQGVAWFNDLDLLLTFVCFSVHSVWYSPPCDVHVADLDVPGIYARLLFRPAVESRAEIRAWWWYYMCSI